METSQRVVDRAQGENENYDRLREGRAHPAGFSSKTLIFCNFYCGILAKTVCQNQSSLFISS